MNDMENLPDLPMPDIKPTPSIRDLVLIKKVDVASTKEQIQEDIITYLDAYDIPVEMSDELCEIIVKNFALLEKHTNV